LEPKVIETVPITTNFFNQCAARKCSAKEFGNESICIIDRDICKESEPVQLVTAIRVMIVKVDESTAQNVKYIRVVLRI